MMNTISAQREQKAPVAEIVFTMPKSAAS